MSFLQIVMIEPMAESCFEIRHRGEIASTQELSAQDAEPKFDLVEPRAMQRQVVKDMLVFGVAQKESTVDLRRQLLGLKGNGVEISHDLAQFQTAMGVEIIDDPIEMFERTEMLGNAKNMSPEIEAGAGLAQVPDDFAAGNREGGNEGAGAESGVFELLFFGFAGEHEFGGRVASEDLHAGFFVAGKNEPSLLAKSGCVEIELANGAGFGDEIFVVAIEPIDALMGFEVGVAKDAMDGAAMDFFGMGFVDDGFGEVIESPARGRAVVIVGFAGGDADDVKSLRGGKAPRPAGARKVLKSGESLLDKAFPPDADGMAFAAEFVGDLQVGRIIGQGRAQNDFAAKNESLGSRTRSDELLQGLLGIEGELHQGSKRPSHGKPPCLPEKRRESTAAHDCPKIPPFCPGQLVMAGDL